MKLLALRVGALTLALIASAQTLKITPTFNSGAKLVCGETKVFLDSIFRGLEGYASPDAAAISAIEKAAPPYDGPLVVLASHSHADHFDEGLVAALLTANRRAQLAGTGQIAGALRQRFPQQVTVVERPFVWQQPGVEVQFLTLPHSGRRWAQLENTGHLIRLCGQTVFHPGDADEVTANFERAFGGRPAIDIALVPAWFLAYDRAAEIMKAVLRPKKIWALHGDLQDMSWIPLVQQRYPAAIIPPVYLRARAKQK